MGQFITEGYRDCSELNAYSSVRNGGVTVVDRSTLFRYPELSLRHTLAAHRQ